MCVYSYSKYGINGRSRVQVYDIFILKGGGGVQQGN